MLHGGGLLGNPGSTTHHHPISPSGSALGLGAGAGSGFGGGLLPSSLSSGLGQMSINPKEFSSPSVAASGPVGGAGTHSANL
jgi:hypothetical protein